MRPSLEERAVSPMVWVCLASLPFLCGSSVCHPLYTRSTHHALLYPLGYSPYSLSPGSSPWHPKSGKVLIFCAPTALGPCCDSRGLSPPSDCELSEGKGLSHPCAQPAENNSCGWSGRTSCAAGTKTPESQRLSTTWVISRSR